MIGRTVALALTGLGGLFMILGALLFFNQWLLKVANFMLIPGIVGLVGLDDLAVLLTRKGNRRGAFAFLAGLFLIIYGWEMVGFILQGYSLFLLFSDNFVPICLNVLVTVVKLLPIIGPVFDRIDDIPWVKQQLAKTGIKV